MVTNWLKHGVKKPGMLTVVSTDNIDILQSHAAVSTSCSWHGTSVQCMQPLPLTGQLCAEEEATTH